MKTIDNLLLAKRSLDVFKNLHSKILEDYKILTDEFELLQAALKEEVKTNRGDAEVQFEDGVVKFQFVTKFRKWFDYDIACSMLTEEEQQEVLDGITEVSRKIDFQALRKLVAEKELPEEVLGSYKEEELSPSVLIKPLNDNK